MLRCLRNTVDGTFDHKENAEKAYARLLKVKTKAGQSQPDKQLQAYLLLLRSPAFQPLLQAPAVSPAPEAEGDARQQNEGEEPSTSARVKEAPLGRTEMLRSTLEVVGRPCKL